MTATLIWRRQGGGAEHVVRLSERGDSIGRAPDNTIRIDSNYVSKHHAALRWATDGWTLVDLGSSNGTLVNGQATTQCVLRSGDRIQIGEDELVFQVEAPHQAAPIASPVMSAPPPPPSAAAASVPVASAAPAKGMSNVMKIGLATGAVLLVVIILMPNRSRQGTPPSAEPAPAADTAPAPASAPSRASEPAAHAPAAAPVAASEAPAVPAAVASPGPAGAAAVVAPPGASAGALYDLAIANIKGGRLVEARKLLLDSLARDSTNVPARERLRQVESAIQIEADRHFSAGQRAFTYLKFQDAIIEWEQVVTMTTPTDPRYRQATDGIQRARARLAPQ